MPMAGVSRMQLTLYLTAVTLPALLICGDARAAPELVQALQSCRAMTLETARLACFDALADGLPAPQIRGAAPLPARASGGLSTLTAPVAGQAMSAPEATTLFGLAPPQSQPLQSIEFELPDIFTGWGPDERIVLPSGQEWIVVDGSRAVYRLTKPKARIVRGTLGAYFLEVEGITQRARVRRIH